MARRAKIQHIGLIGKRWRDRTMGNTYNSVQIMVNGHTVATLAQGYGGGTMYEDRAAIWLVKNGYLPEIEKRTEFGSRHKSVMGYARDLGFKYDSQVLDVPRKKDLDKGVYE
jgi:hypothetical protein